MHLQISVISTGSNVTADEIPAALFIESKSFPTASVSLFHH